MGNGPDQNIKFKVVIFLTIWAEQELQNNLKGDPMQRKENTYFIVSWLEQERETR